MPASPLLVIDAANVVGSVPDGWWRDRAGATRRLRDGLVAIASDGLGLDGGHGIPDALRTGPVEVVLVVEGAAKGVEGVPEVRVVPSPGSGDDTIVEVVREREGGRPCFVATADRELSTRVRSLGAEIIGPRSVRQHR